MDKPLMDLSIDELLAQLKPEDCGDKGLSYEEICVKWGWVPTMANVSRVRFKLHDPLVLGAWVYMGKKQLWNERTKQTVWVKAFRPVGEAKEE